MISFIIIGQNEGWKLIKCFKSIKELVAYNNLQNSEVIFVDSDSNDNSLDIAKGHQVDKIYKISGNINAAVARNIGANAASGEILFFMDGDIELKPFELRTIIDEDKQLKYGYVVGFLDDVNYTNDWKYIKQSPRSYKTEIKDQQVTTVGGGIFIIEKTTWIRFDGMDERLRRTQDRDLSLRMAKNGILGIRKSEVFGLHHTIPYNDSKRMWRMLFDGSINYKGVFIRKHLFNLSFLPKLIHEEWTMIALILSILFLCITPFATIIYLLAVLVKIRKQLKKRSLQILSHRILQDCIVFLSVIFFYPRKPIYKVSQVISM